MLMIGGLGWFAFNYCLMRLYGLAVLLILMLYVVVGGWVLAWCLRCFTGSFSLLRLGGACLRVGLLVGRGVACLIWLIMLLYFYFLICDFVCIFGL